MAETYLNMDYQETNWNGLGLWDGQVTSPPPFLRSRCMGHDCQETRCLQFHTRISPSPSRSSRSSRKRRSISRSSAGSFKRRLSFTTSTPMSSQEDKEPEKESKKIWISRRGVADASISLNPAAQTSLRTQAFSRRSMHSSVVNISASAKQDKMSIKTGQSSHKTPEKPGPDKMASRRGSGSPRLKAFDGMGWIHSPRTGYTYLDSPTYRENWTPDREVPMPHMARPPLHQHRGFPARSRLDFSDEEEPVSSGVISTQKRSPRLGWLSVLFSYVGLVLRFCLYELPAMCTIADTYMLVKDPGKNSELQNEQRQSFSSVISSYFSHFFAQTVTITNRLTRKALNVWPKAKAKIADPVIDTSEEVFEYVRRVITRHWYSWTTLKPEPKVDEKQPVLNFLPLNQNKKGKSKDTFLWLLLIFLFLIPFLLPTWDTLMSTSQLIMTGITSRADHLYQYLVAAVTISKDICYSIIGWTFSSLAELVHLCASLPYLIVQVMWKGGEPAYQYLQGFVNHTSSSLAYGYYALSDSTSTVWGKTSEIPSFMGNLLDGLWNMIFWFISLPYQLLQVTWIDFEPAQNYLQGVGNSSAIMLGEVWKNVSEVPSLVWNIAEMSVFGIYGLMQALVSSIADAFSVVFISLWYGISWSLEQWTDLMTSLWTSWLSLWQSIGQFIANVFSVIFEIPVFIFNQFEELTSASFNLVFSQCTKVFDLGIYSIQELLSLLWTVGSVTFSGLQDGLLWLWDMSIQGTSSAIDFIWTIMTIPFITMQNVIIWIWETLINLLNGSTNYAFYAMNKTSEFGIISMETLISKAEKPLEIAVNITDKGVSAVKYGQEVVSIGIVNLITIPFNMINGLISGLSYATKEFSQICYDIYGTSMSSITSGIASVSNIIISGIVFSFNYLTDAIFSVGSLAINAAGTSLAYLNDLLLYLLSSIIDFTTSVLNSFGTGTEYLSTMLSDTVTVCAKFCSNMHSVIINTISFGGQTFLDYLVVFWETLFLPVSSVFNWVASVPQLCISLGSTILNGIYNVACEMFSMATSIFDLLYLTITSSFISFAGILSPAVSTSNTKFKSVPSDKTSADLTGLLKSPGLKDVVNSAIEKEFGSLKEEIEAKIKSAKLDFTLHAHDHSTTLQNSEKTLKDKIESSHQELLAKLEDLEVKTIHEQSEIKESLEVLTQKVEFHQDNIGDRILKVEQKVKLWEQEYEKFRLLLKNCCNQTALISTDILALVKENFDSFNDLFITKEESKMAISNLSNIIHHEVLPKFISLTKDVVKDEFEKERISQAAKQQINAKDDLSKELENHILNLIHSSLMLYNADKTGLFDYALETAGGSVVNTRCTETYSLKTAAYTLFGIPLWYPFNNPRTAIQPGVQPGECWAFKGVQGFMVIKLSMAMVPTGFSLEHIPKSLSPDGKITSAPKDFHVLGLADEYDKNPVNLGHFRYEIDQVPVQYYEAENESKKTFPYVELVITSNHGNQNYTCLYRFRVHGQP